MRRTRASARVLIGHHRTRGSDFWLALILAFVAGGANAGGFFALGQYTSHMTGYLSQVADMLVLRDYWLAFVAALAIAAFVTGAALCTFLIHWARSHGQRRRQYALPIAVQGLLLLGFAGGDLLSGALGRLMALAGLCLVMGMQNATITKISNARIRTTHATGMLTDIGMELGREAYGRVAGTGLVRARRERLSMFAALVLAFLLGGIVGALGYSALGFSFSLPLGLILLTLAGLGWARGDGRR